MSAVRAKPITTKNKIKVKDLRGNMSSQVIFLVLFGSSVLPTIRVESQRQRSHYKKPLQERLVADTKLVTIDKKVSV